MRSTKLAVIANEANEAKMTCANSYAIMHFDYRSNIHCLASSISTSSKSRLRNLSLKHQLQRSIHHLRDLTTRKSQLITNACVSRSSLPAQERYRATTTNPPNPSSPIHLLLPANPPPALPRLTPQVHSSTSHTYLERRTINNRNQPVFIVRHKVPNPDANAPDPHADHELGGERMTAKFKELFGKNKKGKDKDGEGGEGEAAAGGDGAAAAA
ncbi:hypothetical protein K490DRAFT_61699 [Saccharata proteae CBS 121410]|uniref:Uncharacterized protein n=1 Tax=Saccharata proteae CBS 121410 TaxID=1314787 RepID=A0A9P4M3W0_9PEZI|nr:hypothetical protein K490DRAFT_61699 [Saccharata proteae CBS 121410]